MHARLAGGLLLDDAVSHVLQLGREPLAIALGRPIALMVVVVTPQARELVTRALHMTARAPETRARVALTELSKPERKRKREKRTRTHGRSNP